MLLSNTHLSLVTSSIVFFFKNPTTTEIYTLSYTTLFRSRIAERRFDVPCAQPAREHLHRQARSEEHTSELQSHSDIVCRLLLEKKKRRLTILHSAARYGPIISVARESDGTNGRRIGMHMT